MTDTGFIKKRNPRIFHIKITLKHNKVTEQKTFFRAKNVCLTWKKLTVKVCITGPDERVYYLGSHYLTRFLTMTEVNRNQLQLLAAACLLLRYSFIQEAIYSAYKKWLPTDIPLVN